MSDTLRNTINFPGLESPVTGTYTLQHGTRPGFAVIDCNPVDLEQLEMSGTVELGDGNTSLYIPNCRIDSADLTRDTSGVFIRLYLLDRRWKWAYYTISGHYNEPVPRVFTIRPVPLIDGKRPQNPGDQPAPTDDPSITGELPSIQKITQRSARELGKLLFDKLGEKRYSVSALPDNDYPEVKWEVANVANELDNLCERYGCRVAYNPMTDTAGVVRLGIGGDLPSPGPGEDGGLTVGLDPPDPPKRIAIYTAPMEYQVMFELEAVGLDLDNRVRPLNELSYKPAEGWEYFEPPAVFTASTVFNRPLPEGYSWIDANNAAKQSLYRWFRIKNTFPIDNVNVEQQFWFPVNSRGGADAIAHRAQIELRPYLVETTMDSFGQYLVVPAKVYGVTLRGSANRDETKLNEEVRESFTIVPDQQIVQFGRAMVRSRLAASSNRVEVAPATLMLLCACRLRENGTGAYRRYRYEAVVPGSPRGKRKPDGADELALLHDELRYWHRTEYEITPPGVFSANFNLANAVKTTRLMSNRPAVRAQAKYYSYAALARFQTKATATQKYNGIKLVFTDGVTHSVSWHVGPVPFTVAAAHSERPAIDVPYLVARRQAETSLARLSEAKKTLNSIRGRIKLARSYGYVP